MLDEERPTNALKICHLCTSLARDIFSAVLSRYILKREEQPGD
jgi:hypothetical protein